MFEIRGLMRSLFFEDVWRTSSFSLLFITILIFWQVSASLAADVGYGKGDYEPLADTGQTTCYDVEGNEITCPGQDSALYGQDANYQGTQKSFTPMTVNGDEVVVDNNTELMWQKTTADTDNDGTISVNDVLNWHSAVDYCNALVFAGYSDWRLPEVFELITIVDYGRYDPAIDASVFECRPFTYWSATTYTYINVYALNLNFYNGGDRAMYRSFSYYVRCVRAGL